MHVKLRSNDVSPYYLQIVYIVLHC